MKTHRFRNTDKDDFAPSAVKISATSCRAGFEPENIVSGVTRAEDGKSNCYVSQGIGPEGETLTLSFDRQRRFSEIRTVFDPNLNAEIMVSMTPGCRSAKSKACRPNWSEIFRLRSAAAVKPYGLITSKTIFADFAYCRFRKGSAEMNSA